MSAIARRRTVSQVNQLVACYSELQRAHLPCSSPVRSANFCQGSPIVDPNRDRRDRALSVPLVALHCDRPCFPWKWDSAVALLISGMENHISPCRDFRPAWTSATGFDWWSRTRLEADRHGGSCETGTKVNSGGPKTDPIQVLARHADAPLDATFELGSAGAPFEFDFDGIAEHTGILLHG